MKNNTKKILVIFVLILSYIIISLIFCNKSFAITQTTSTDINSINSSQYPQVKELIQGLKKIHPNWNFKILYTDIDWNEAIANEYVGHGTSPRNLVPANNSNYDGDWICKICGEKKYDTGAWHCASEATIAYMMDARNSINSSDIFQFLELSYTEYNIQTIRKMVTNTFLNNESYINAIISAAQRYNVNAYYIVARILQEQGNDGTVLSSGKGYNGQYVGYYNVFNIGATGNGNKQSAILNGLNKACKEGWTTLESSIDGGVSIIASQYIARGQNTVYLQKFDVDYSDRNLYWHQYMQNILAAQSEGAKIRKTFASVGSIDAEYTFIIPVFKNMPSSACTRPSSTSSTEKPTTSELVKINVTNSLRLRNAPNGSTTVGWVYKDEIVTRLEKATQKVNGTYWDYVMKSDGTKGYAARETYENEATYKLYLVPIETEKPDNPSNHDIVKDEKVKLDKTTNEISTIPNATVQDLRNLIGNDIVVKDINGTIITDQSKLSTGCTINDVYTISVLGDVNGDGIVNSADLLAIQKDLLKVKQIEEKCKENAADVNQDETINSADLLKIQKELLGVAKIGI